MWRLVDWWPKELGPGNRQVPRQQSADGTPHNFGTLLTSAKRDLDSPSIQMACFASDRQSRLGLHCEHKRRGFKITEPKLGRSNVITVHYGQANLNG